MMRDLERYARNIRNENRATITTHKNAPKKNEGVDGDIRINTTTTEGVKLFSKYNGEWYSTPLSKHIIKEKNQDRRTLASMSSLAEDGYQELDSGLIIQWGSEGDGTTDDLGSSTAVTFPKEFPQQCFNVIGTHGQEGTDTGGGDYEAQPRIATITTSGVTFSTATNYEKLFWMAIGY